MNTSNIDAPVKDLSYYRRKYEMALSAIKDLEAECERLRLQIPDPIGELLDEDDEKTV